MAEEVLEFDCPRCSTSVSDRYYGPCEACRVQLRATMQRTGEAAEAAEYEPKMNVVPNAVASKE